MVSNMEKYIIKRDKGSRGARGKYCEYMKITDIELCKMHFLVRCFRLSLFCRICFVEHLI